MRGRRHDELDRYLLDGERLVTAVHQHWGKIAEPVATTMVGTVAALWVDAAMPASMRLASTIVWWLWFALVARLAYLVIEWRHDWFVATDKRLLLFYGFVTRKVSMMPLMKVTDMSYERSIPGRVFGYGRFVMESAGQDQALHEVNWVPSPDANYRAICAEMFRVADRGLPEDGVWDARNDDAGPPPAPEPPDPYAGWDDPPPRPRPRRRDSGTLYRSADLRARDRSAETGPIPLRNRHERDDD
ncbi:PH domain-containing protein [Pedococcus sp.]|uniref:PH domain-containing protein n=1 Tax=Pedococcus sp. TaxID=2860345 RepID=UPI002E164D0B|nr:PH domain-containing protein [Pedococcus sp.]